MAGTGKLGQQAVHLHVFRYLSNQLRGLPGQKKSVSCGHLTFLLICIFYSCTVHISLINFVHKYQHQGLSILSSFPFYVIFPMYSASLFSLLLYSISAKCSMFHLKSHTPNEITFYYMHQVYTHHHNKDLYKVEGDSCALFVVNLMFC